MSDSIVPTWPAGVVRFRRRWIRAFVIGELVGFSAPAATGAALAAVEAPDAVLVVGLTGAGLVEGVVLGFAQSRVLAVDAPALDGRSWVVATAIAAGFAWLVGMSGGALMGHAPSPRLLAVLVPAWIAAFLSIGFAQWWVMRRTIPHASRWVWVNAGAWLVGVTIPVVTLSIVPNGWPAVALGAVGLAAAVAMGATVGPLTEVELGRLLRHMSHAPSATSMTDHRL
jgi:hypothetical protein